MILEELVLAEPYHRVADIGVPGEVDERDSPCAPEKGQKLGRDSSSQVCE